MTHDEIQQIALMRMEICDLQRQNTLLQRCLAQVSSDQVAMLELLRIACSKKIQRGHLTPVGIRSRVNSR